MKKLQTILFILILLTTVFTQNQDSKKFYKIIVIDGFIYGEKK